MENTNRYNRESLVLFFIGSRQNKVDINKFKSDIAHFLSSESYIRLYEELESFETENSAQFTGGYASSSLWEGFA
jgi:hypothetical protein